MTTESLHRSRHKLRRAPGNEPPVYFSRSAYAVGEARPQRSISDSIRSASCCGN
jgi:hypothetical protein